MYIRLAHEGQALLFDCGDLTPLNTRNLLRLQVVVISHTHIDHFVGFDRLLRTFLYQQRTLTLCGPPGIAQAVRQRLQGYTWNLTGGFSFMLRIHEWHPPYMRHYSLEAAQGFSLRPVASHWVPDQQPCLYRNSLYSLWGRLLDHGGIPSLAVRLQEPVRIAIHPERLQALGLRPGRWLSHFKQLIRQQAPQKTEITAQGVNGEAITYSLAWLQNRIAHVEPGRSIGYITDISPHVTNLRQACRLLRGCNLLACEATFSHKELARARHRHHLTARCAGWLGRITGAQKLLLFHYSPRYSDNLAPLQQEAMAAFNPPGQPGSPRMATQAHI